MWSRYRQRTKHSPGVSMDSLVDIVSNNVGILLLLAVFMALLTLGADAPSVVENASSSQNTLLEKATSSGEQSALADLPPAQPTYRHINIPWSHPTEKRLAFFHIQANRVLHLDLNLFYLWLAQQKPALEVVPLTFSKGELTVRFFPVTSHVHCLDFLPARQAGELWTNTQSAQSMWQRVLKEYPKEKFVWFFWVYQEDFALFRLVRDQLWSKGYEVSWRPRVKQGKLEYCNSFEDALSFRPQ